MEYQKPELIDASPAGDTVKEAILKTDTNVDDIYWSLNDILTKIPDFAEPDKYYKLDGTYPLTANFAAGNFILRAVADPVLDNDAATQGWCNRQYLTLTGGVMTGLISCDITPTESSHLANKAYVDANGGGGGGVWGLITGDIDTQADLKAKLDNKADSGHIHNDATPTVSGFMPFADKEKLDKMSDPALFEEFKSFSTGTPDAGMPIKLDSYGVLDVSFISIRIFNLEGDWTPTAGNEYPTPADPGDYWIIENVGDIVSGGYTFTSGFLSGKTIYDNELLVKGRDDKWGIIHMKVDPNLYYRLDGTNHLTADFQAGGFKLAAVAAGTVATDAVNKGQLDAELAGYLPLTGGTLTGSLHINHTSPGLTLFETDSPLGVYWRMMSGGSSLLFQKVKSDGSSLGNSIVIYGGTEDVIPQLRGEASGWSIEGNDIWHAGNFDPDTKLDLTGGTLNGNLSIKSDNPRLIVNSTDSHGLLAFEKNDIPWWVIGRDDLGLLIFGQMNTATGAWMGNFFEIYPDNANVIPKLTGASDGWKISGAKIYTDDYHPGTGGSVDWGDIGGTLSNQTDLQGALDDKQHQVTISTSAPSGGNPGDVWMKI
jgi:hypothetical protein